MAREPINPGPDVLPEKQPPDIPSPGPDMPDPPEPIRTYLRRIRLLAQTCDRPVALQYFQSEFLRIAVRLLGALSLLSLQLNSPFASAMQTQAMEQDVSKQRERGAELISISEGGYWRGPSRRQPRRILPHGLQRSKLDAFVHVRQEAPRLGRGEVKVIGGASRPVMPMVNRPVPALNTGWPSASALTELVLCHNAINSSQIKRPEAPVR